MRTPAAGCGVHCLALGDATQPKSAPEIIKYNDAEVCDFFPTPSTDTSSSKRDNCAELFECEERFLEDFRTRLQEGIFVRHHDAFGKSHPRLLCLSRGDIALVSSKLKVGSPCTQNPASPVYEGEHIKLNQIVDLRVGEFGDIPMPSSVRPQHCVCLITEHGAINLELADNEGRDICADGLRLLIDRTVRADSLMASPSSISTLPSDVSTDGTAPSQAAAMPMSPFATPEGPSARHSANYYGFASPWNAHKVTEKLPTY